MTQESSPDLPKKEHQRTKMASLQCFHGPTRSKTVRKTGKATNLSITICTVPHSSPFYVDGLFRKKNCFRVFTSRVRSANNHQIRLHLTAISMKWNISNTTGSEMSRMPP